MVEGSGPNLIGRDWLHFIQSDWKSLGVTAVRETAKVLDDLFTQYKDIFCDELGTIRT